ncbi:MAG: hypothetical protein AAGD28_02160 [Bacteroidota bacterium]
MKEQLIYLGFLSLFFLACQEERKSLSHTNPYLASELPSNEPLDLDFIQIPEGMLVHRGVFSPDLNHFYYTLSPGDFSQFDIYVMEKEGKVWSMGKKAIFNSDYSDHGMSFSADGKRIYFSSTRPVHEEGVPSTWHLWKSERVGENWGEAQYIDIPNLRDKLLSHPSIGNSDRLYFHASNLDYSEMNLYYAEKQDGKYQEAIQVEIPNMEDFDLCTPYISPNEDYLIFARVSNQLDLMITHKTPAGQWAEAQAFSKQINTKGQGNPYISPDQKFLFYAAENDSAEGWSIKWANVESELKNN